MTAARSPEHDRGITPCCADASAQLPRRWGVACLAAAIGLSLAAYASSLGGEFVFDDFPLLVGNSCHRGLARIGELFDPRAGGICTLRPLRFVSFALDHAVWGDRPFGYHLTNVLLHGVVAWLALALIWRLTRDRLLAALAALLFLLHPIATEAVAYISGRRDLLMALFCLAAANGYLAFVERGGWWRIALVLGSTVAALLSHEAAAALPGALVVLELLRWRAVRRDEAGRAGRRRRVFALGLLLMLCLAFAAWISTSRNFSSRRGLWGPSLGAHVATVARVHAHYLRQLALPTNLIADYSPEGFDLSRSPTEPRALVALLAVAGLAGLGLALHRRHPLVSAAVLGYFVLLLPASQIIVHHELLAEHRLYLPSLCFCALVAAGLRHGLRRRRVTWALVCVVAATYLILVQARNLDWRSSESLWTATVAQVPRCARARANLGAALATRGRLLEARQHIELALTIRPELCDAWTNLAHLLKDLGERPASQQAQRRASRCRAARSP